jgi:simple sugar transport system permease protein
VAIPLCVAAAFAGGALIGALPGLLKAKVGAHEVISTIMLNFIVRAAMVGVGLHAFMKESVHTAEVVPAAVLPRLGRFVPPFSGSAVNGALFVALGAAGLANWFLARTRVGFQLRAVGASPRAAETAGIPVGRLQILAFALAGGLSGLVGANFVLGYKHYYEDGFSGGTGFMGIAVAVLGGSRPLGVVLAALAFGTLMQGALAINAVCPKELIDVLEAVVILAVAAVAAADARRPGGTA